MSNQEEIGTLVVVVLKARNLNDKHFYKQDVYATVTLNGVKKTTPIDVKGGQHPVWDVEIRFPIMKDTSSKARTLEASCFSKEHKDDDLLGEGKVDINETLKTGEFDDWVPLSANGSSRGDIYLEMTYYSNGPAPANLSAPNNLTRRPSKLSPADRVWRPPQGHTPPKSHANLPPQTSAIGPPTPPKSSPKHDNAALPQFQVQSVPATLKPGLTAGRISTPQQSYQAQPTSRVPTILRPANPKGASDSSLNHSRRSSTHEPESLPTPPFGTNGQPSTGIPSYPQPSNQNSYVSIPNANFGPPSNSWGYNQHPNPHSADAPISFSFPVPDVTSPTLPTPSPPRSTTPYDPAPPGSYYQPHSFSPAPPPTHHRNSSASEYPHSYRPQTENENLPDPYLIARYQTPLPLPPGAERPAPRPAPQHHRTSSFPSSSSEQVSSPTLPPLPHDKPQPPLSVPPRPTPPIRQPTPVDEERLRVLREAEERAARRREQEERDAELARQLDRDLATEQDQPPPPPVPRKSKTPSPTRYDGINSRYQSDAEARRRAQEEKDLELARQLDRELNLDGNDRPPSPRIPGGV